MAKSDNLRKAKAVKNDNFFTRLEDIIAEIAQHKDYVKQFEGKVVLCNCDDPEWSAFVEFFRKFFHKLKLKKMIATHYNADGSPSLMIFFTTKNKITFSVVSGRTCISIHNLYILPVHV